MRTRLILLIVLFAAGAHGATWYATNCTSQSISGPTCQWWSGAGASSCPTTGSGTQQSWPPPDGDTVVANGCTAIAIIATTTGFAGPTGLTLRTDGSPNAGGGFTYTCGAAVTLYMTRIAGSSNVLSISGACTGTTIVGDATGGNLAGSNAFGTDTTNTGSLSFTAGPNGFTGGSVGTNPYGLYLHMTGNVTITSGAGRAGIGSGSSAHGIFHSLATGNVTMTGDCYGSDASTATYGCATTNSSAGTFTVTGNLINGKKSAATNGGIFYTPSPTNYTCWAKNGSYIIGTEDCTHGTLANGQKMGSAGTAVCGGTCAGPIN